MNRYGLKENLPTQERCKECSELTMYRCMECLKAVCTMCSFSMHAMCQTCREAYTGPIWQLGKRADAYIRAELDQIFR